MSEEISQKAPITEAISNNDPSIFSVRPELLFVGLFRLSMSRYFSSLPRPHPHLEIEVLDR